MEVDPITQTQAITPDSEGNGELITKQNQCDRCKDPVKAVCYCTECDRKLCRHHEQVIFS